MRHFGLFLISLTACSTFGSPLADVTVTRTLLPAARLVELSNAFPRDRSIYGFSPYWNPTIEELKACEAKLRARWGDYRYDIQYFGTTESGKRVLHVRGECAGRYRLVEMDDFPLFVMGGGRCHFSATCKERTWPKSSLHFSNRGRGR